MKSSFTVHVIAGVATLSLFLSPALIAQTTPTDASQNSKATDSMANQNSADTGTSATPASAPDKTNSKDTTNSLDPNPSTAPTDSGDKSATKNPGGAEDQTKSATGSTHLSDRQFLLNAAQGGMTEVELGKLAQEKGSSADVKEFGSQMVTDHSKANDELKSVAEKKGITVPDALDAKHQAMVDHFKHLSGTAFDRAYIHAMVRDHQKDVALFREAASDAEDPDVKAFAENTLTVVEAHLAHIKSIQGGAQ
jgi:putative membrane protein